MPESTERLHPCNVDAEKTILGAILTHPPALHDAREVLASSDFYPEAHRIIFNCMVELQESKSPIDILTVKTALKTAGKLEAIGGIPYLSTLGEGVPSVANVRHYATLVKETSVLRRIAWLNSMAIEKAMSGELKAKSIIDDLQSELLKLAQHGSGKGFRPMSEFVNEAFKSIEDMSRKKDGVTGLDTGLRSLNWLTQGFKPGQLVLIGGRPGHGKTALGQFMVNHVVLRKQGRVGVFHLEMSGKELAERAIYAEAPLDKQSIHSGGLNWSSITAACDRLARSSLWIDDSADLTVTELTARAHRLAIEHKVDLIVVDYLQLVDGAIRKGETREREISRVSRALKIIAKDLNIPVVAMSQLSREVLHSSRRPQLSDLRESGSLEQDADIVLLLWRDELREETEENKGIAELQIAKHRSGRSGDTILLNFDREYCRFRERENG